MRLGKIIGVGNTATVYELGDQKVLKLFKGGYPDEAVETEYHNAMTIRDMNFLKPKAYEMIFCEERTGIIYDKIEGQSLLDWVMKTQDIEQCAIYMANLHKTIGQNRISNVPNYKDFLKYHIQNASLSLDRLNDIIQMIDQLPNGNTLCHGDFHPGNILLYDDKVYTIDFMNICCGDFLYDIARTVYLVQFTPIPPEAKDKEMMLYLKNTLTDLYLKQMNVTREMIQDYLFVIAAARKGECPNE